MTNKKAESAPAAVSVSDDAAAAELRKREDEARRVKPVQVAPPPPAPGMAQEEDRARLNNPQSAWLGNPVREAWLVEAAADTKEAVMAEMAQSIIARFNADAALAAGGAVTSEWINSQILTYQLPITEDEVRQATTAAFGEAGIQVQG